MALKFVKNFFLKYLSIIRNSNVICMLQSNKASINSWKIMYWLLSQMLWSLNILSRTIHIITFRTFHECLLKWILLVNQTIKGLRNILSFYLCEQYCWKSQFKASDYTSISILNWDAFIKSIEIQLQIKEMIFVDRFDYR